MGGILTYTTTNPTNTDTTLITLQKTLQVMNGAGVNITVAGAQKYSGAGAPSSVPSNAAAPADYLNTNNNEFYTWNPATQAWVLQIAV